MKLLLRLLRSAWYTGWYLLALSIVLGAVTLSLLRMALPSIAENYSADVEALLADVMKRPVTIGTMDADWEGLGPRLILRDVVFPRADGTGVSLNLQSASLGFSPLALLLGNRFGLSTVSLSGFNLILRRNDDDSIDISGLAEATPEALSATGDRNGEQELTGWLLAHGHVEVLDANVYWIDQRSDGRVWQFRDVNVALRHRDGRYRLQGEAGLPGELGRDVEFVLDLEGDVSRPVTWSGRSWIKVRDLDYGAVRTALSIPQEPIADGRVSAEVWGDWRQGSPWRLLGSFSATELSLQNRSGGELKIERLGSRFRWRRDDTSMQLDLAGLEARWPGQAWDRVDLGMGWQRDSADRGMHLEQLYSSYADIRGVLALAGHYDMVPAQAATWLERLQPTGVLRDLVLHRSATAERGFLVQAEFTGLSNRPWGTVPGVSGLSGELRTDLSDAVVRIDSQAARLDYPDYMAHPLAVDQLEGTVWVRLRSDYIQINTSELFIRNSESSGHMTVGVYWPHERPRPWLEIHAGMREGRLATVLENLPVTLIGKPFRDWWDAAISKGQIQGGTVAHAGWTNEYPYLNGNGRLALASEVKGLHLQYLQEWPPLTNANAAVVMSEGHLRIDVQRGNILTTPARKGVVEVPDINDPDPMLRIRGQFAGPSSDKLDYILQAPPLRSIFSAVADYQVDGDSRLDLDVQVPILRPEDTAVSGKVAVTDNTVTFRGDLGRILEAVNTEVEFDERSVSAADGAALLFNQPVRMAIQTRDDGGDRRSVLVTAKGDYQVDSLMQRFDVENWRHLGSGEDKFLAVLQLPIGDGGVRHPQLNLRASLKNVESSLPKPLSKDKGEDRTLSLRLVFKPEVHEWFVDDGHNLHAAVAMLPLPEGYSVSHGEVLIGTGRADVAWKDGLRLRGELPHLSLDEWTRAIAGARGDPEPGRVAGWDPLPAWVQRVELNVDTLRLFDRDYSQVRLRADRHQAGLLVAVNSHEIIGDINLPANPETPVNLRLQYWNLISSREENPLYSKPTELPGMLVECDDFRFNDGELGRLSVVVTPTQNGIRLDKIEIHSSHTNLLGALDWEWRDGAHYSSAELSIESRDVGRSMAGLGYADTVMGGTAQVSIRASWPNAPPEFLSDHLGGEIHMKLQDGSLLQIDPGAGRALAIFSLQMLPQRLLLDFRDLYSDGFAFSKVTGDFSIQEGDAYTTNLVMEGPSSKILIAGRTGLAQRDYDQLVTVIPEVTASIPVLAWWLVDLPAGVMALALQKLFQSEIDDVVKFQYIISGTWSDPVITKVEEQSATQNSPAAR